MNTDVFAVAFLGKDIKAFTVRATSHKKLNFINFHFQSVFICVHPWF